MSTREKPCSQCGVVFSFEVGLRTGRHPNYCPSCRVQRERDANRRKQYRWRESHPEEWKAARDRAWAKRAADPAYLEKKRNWETARLYGLTPEQYSVMAEVQGGVCAICGGSPGKIGRRGEPGRLHVDHHHSTGAIRGLLCGNCNTMLGLAKDNPEILLRAIAYLNKE